MEFKSNIDLPSVANGLKGPGNLKRKTEWTGEGQSSIKRAKFDVSSSEICRTPKTALFSDPILYSNGEKERVQKSGKPIARNHHNALFAHPTSENKTTFLTISNNITQRNDKPTSQKYHDERVKDGIKINFKQKNPENVNRNSVVISNTSVLTDEKIKNSSLESTKNFVASGEGNIHANKQDIFGLTDIERQGIINSQEMSFMFNLTPQKTDKLDNFQVIKNESFQVHSKSNTSIAESFAVIPNVSINTQEKVKNLSLNNNKESTNKFIASGEGNINNSRLEFFHTEGQENISQKSTDFIYNRTPQNTYKQDYIHAIKNKNKSISTFAPNKKKKDVIKESKNTCSSFLSKELRKNNYFNEEIFKVSKVINSPPHNSMSNSAKKFESFKRNLNFQDLYSTDVTEILFKHSTDKSSMKSQSEEKNYSDVSDSTICDFFQSQIVVENLRSKDTLYFDKNQDKQANHKNMIGNSKTKLTDSINFKTENNLLLSTEMLQQKRKANSTRVTQSDVDTMLQTNVCINQKSMDFSNPIHLPHSAIINDAMENLAVSATNNSEELEMVKLNSDENNSDSTFCDEKSASVFNSQNEGEYVKSSGLFYLEGGQQNECDGSSNFQSKQTDNAKDKCTKLDESFPFVFSQQQCETDFLDKRTTNNENNIFKLEGNSNIKNKNIFVCNKSKGYLKKNPNIKGHNNSNYEDKKLDDFPFFSQPQCKADHSRLNTKKLHEQAFKSSKQSESFKLTDLSHLKGNLDKSEDVSFEHKKLVSFINLEEVPNKEQDVNSVSEDIASSKDIKLDDMFGFFFSQPQCKADELRLTKNKIQICEKQNVKSNKTPLFNLIEEESQELLQQKHFSQPSPFTEESKTTENKLKSRFKSTDLPCLKDSSEKENQTSFEHKKSTSFINLEDVPNEKHITFDCSKDIKADVTFGLFFSQPQCKADQLRLNKKKIYNQTFKSRNESKSLKLTDLPYLEGSSDKAKDIRFVHKKSISFINLEEIPNKKQHINSENHNLIKSDDTFGLFFSQPQCKADQVRLNKNEFQICKEQNVKSNRTLLFNCIEEESQEQLQNCFSQPLPITEERKTTGVNFSSGKILINYGKSFQERNSTFWTSKHEVKLKKYNEQEDMRLSQRRTSELSYDDNNRNVSTTENVNQKNAVNKEGGGIFDRSNTLSKITDDADSFISDFSFCESKRKNYFIHQHESENIKFKNFDNDNRNIAADNKNNLKDQETNQLKLQEEKRQDYPQRYFSQKLLMSAETNRECTHERINLKSLSCKKQTFNEDISAEDFILRFCNAHQVHDKCSTIYNIRKLNKDEQKRQDTLNSNDNINAKSNGFIFNEGSKNFEEFLEDIYDSIDKVKMNTCDKETSSTSHNSNSQKQVVTENQIALRDLCVPKMKDSKHYSMLQNKDLLFTSAIEFEDFARRHLEIINNQQNISQNTQYLSDLNSQKCVCKKNVPITAYDNRIKETHQNMDNTILGPTLEDTFKRTFINRTLSNGALSTGSKENMTQPEKRLRQGLNHIIKEKSLLCQEKDDTLSTPSQVIKLRIIDKIQKIFTRLRDDVAENKSPILEIRNQKDWNNCLFKNNRLIMKPFGEASTIIINYRKKSSTLKFNLIIFLLGKIVNMLSQNSTCTKRELYYQLIKSVKNETQLRTALDSVSCLLDEPPWHLGILAMTKGLIYGDLKIVFSDQIMHCNILGGSLIPQDVKKITQLVSDAYFILIIEKDAIFQKFLKDDLPRKLTRPFIMITGKGYPDLNLRFFVKKLAIAMSVPVFILVDADPYGIDIMLTYRFGSLNMSHLNECLAIPNAQWIGVHPSEIIDLNISRQPLTHKDKAKIKNILKRPYCTFFPKLKDELEVLMKNNFKAEIEGLLKSDMFLRDFYLPNKFFTQDYI